MRKITPALLGIVLLFSACQKSVTPSDNTDEVQAITQRSCGAYEVLQEQLKTDPTLKQRMDQIETFTNRLIQSGKANKANATIEIPVVVHVIYNTNAQNISDDQVNSQITVLNKDYSATNGDIGSTPALFKSVTSSGFNVHFSIAAINHVKTKVRSFSTNDAVKHTSKGGEDAIDPEHKLNIWVCNLGRGLLGYAQFPGGNWATDGVVNLYSAFGSRSVYPGGTYISKYDLGHWMNLRHIWGDDGGSCSGSDLVGDTPNQGSENYGCPSFPHVSCSNSGDMSMNYMDYTDDACMYMFSAGQATRGLAVFAAGGPRAALAGN
jgi:hypothetical protein